MNFGIIEDQTAYVESLKNQLYMWCNLKKNITCNVKVAKSKEEFENDLTAFLNCDFLFFDMQLTPECKNQGLILSEKITNEGFDGNIVFITNHEELAVQSFSVMPVGYLLKPVDTNKLYTLLDKLWKKIQDPELFIFYENKKPQYVPFSLISYFEATNHKIRFRTIIDDLSEDEVKRLNRMNRIAGRSICKYKSEYFCSGSIQEIIEKTGDISYFVQARRNYVLNVNHIAVMPAQKAEMTNGERIPVGTRFRNAVRECYLGSEKFVGRKKNVTKAF